MNRRDSDLLAHMNRRLRAADRSNTMNKLETLIAAVSAQIRADFAGVNLDDIERVEAHFDLFERAKAEPEPIKIDHPWTDWVAGDVDKYPIPGETKIIGRLRAGITVKGFAKDFYWRELGGGGTLVAYKILEAAPEQKPEPADGEPKFIEWNGGENPVPGKLVEYKLRCGGKCRLPSDDLDWSHDGVNGDIVGYRVVGEDQGDETQENAAEPDDQGDGWIEWGGSPILRPTGPVQVRFRDGSVGTGEADSWIWAVTSYEAPDDIVAYRYLDKSGSEHADAEAFDEVDEADGIRIDALTAEEVRILNEIRRMRRHGIAYIETLQGPISTSEGLVFPDQGLVGDAQHRLGRAFDDLILAIAR